MPWIRAVCAVLCERGWVQITQRGVAVACSGYRGPIRIALTDAGRQVAADIADNDVDVP